MKPLLIYASNLAKNPKDKASPSNPKRIVLTSSIAGQAYGLPTPLYFASKHAISGFTRSLGALDESLGIRVNAVAPVRKPLCADILTSRRVSSSSLVAIYLCITKSPCVSYRYLHNETNCFHLQTEFCWESY
jgi:NAD(P)-dependent dehydrogenase (short-subunit alcohol dehydrogenase family)